ncbi:SixA phosphatase family protein [Agromyces seonyuensis]|uniref:Phosphohistidine phosphatase n=1 Tax=Agromyces seonyuensis TaxID=2662446 RepID=A0A6I4P403_9MICO|nr:histidine phosphatase family protein [Agromyces seonyuensis]MWB98004.1 phosphohistidine phosphatase [Agromyces seonyuensis]
MKTLFLVRHAKSDWGDPGLADHDRPLDARGQRDAPAMGLRLAERHVRPDVILTSTALRARTTAAAIAGALGLDGLVVEKRSLYGASSRGILSVAAGLPSEAESAMLVGHNPGMSEAVSELCGEWLELPTCAVAELVLDVGDWAEVVEGTGELARLSVPGDR